jgi:hypothetical protein
VPAIAVFANGLDRSDRPVRGFLPRKTTPRDLYKATVFAKLLAEAFEVRSLPGDQQESLDHAHLARAS